MSTNKLSDDPCYLKSKNNNNNKMLNYQIGNVNIIDDIPRKSYMASMNTQGLYQSRGVDHDGTMIDAESDLRLGSMNIKCDSKASKVNVNNVPRLNMGFMGAGRTSIVNPDIHSNLITGNPSNINKVNEINIFNRFEPLLPSIQRKYNNTDNFIERGWVRGGISSRGNIRNMNYSLECRTQR